VLEGTPASVSRFAAKKLHELKVTVKLETKILGEAKMPDGRTELTLSDGQKIVTDLYLPTVGVSPNSSYVPHNLLNANGFVIVDEFLRVKGTKDVWAVGDISSIQKPQFVNTHKQSVHLAKNIGLLMKGKDLVRYVVDPKGVFVQ
jgi:NADH dehydrogenase FAD-containing subunit